MFLIISFVRLQNEAAVRTAVPGSILPFSSSNEAPPSVEKWDMFDAQPPIAALAESPNDWQHTILRSLGSHDFGDGVRAVRKSFNFKYTPVFCAVHSRQLFASLYGSHRWFWVTISSAMLHSGTLASSLIHSVWQIRSSGKCTSIFRRQHTNVYLISMTIRKWLSRSREGTSNLKSFWGVCHRTSDNQLVNLQNQIF